VSRKLIDWRSVLTTSALSISRRMRAAPDTVAAKVTPDHADPEGRSVAELGEARRARQAGIGDGAEPENQENVPCVNRRTVSHPQER
jgi:hypothetical protein